VTVRHGGIQRRKPGQWVGCGDHHCWHGEILRRSMPEIVPAGTKASVFIDCSTGMWTVPRPRNGTWPRRMACFRAMRRFGWRLRCSSGNADLSMARRQTAQKAFKAVLRHCLRHGQKAGALPARAGADPNRQNLRTTCCSASRMIGTCEAFGAGRGKLGLSHRACSMWSRLFWLLLVGQHRIALVPVWVRKRPGGQRTTTGFAR